MRTLLNLNEPLLQVFDPEDDEDLVLGFVEVEAEKDCVERLVAALDGKFSAMQVQKRMRELGLCKRKVKRTPITDRKTAQTKSALLRTKP